MAESNQRTVALDRPLRALVVGLGVQGRKRRCIVEAHPADTVAGAVDPVAKDAEWRDISEVPPSAYDVALCCTPDGPKVELLTHLLEHGKHTLVEKPLWAADPMDIAHLQALARRHGATCYTAYNHRFEPHFVRMRSLLLSGRLGKVYHCRLFYGNGTARLVRESDWRDQGTGVLHDLGSHLLDTVAFWLGVRRRDFRALSMDRFENSAPDHVSFATTEVGPRVSCEATLLSWRNHFTADVHAEHGSAHIRSLCKWGPSTFTHRQRVLPSGRPPEESVTLVQDDPTWAAEYEHFRSLAHKRVETDLSGDIWLHQTLETLRQEIGA